MEALPRSASSQSSSLTLAWNNLVEAFVATQDADSHGASHDDIVQLSTELNTALGYYENASILLAENNSTGADDYASLSIDLSSNITSRAAQLQTSAQRQRLTQQEIAYTTALVAAAISAFAIIEFHRINRFWHKKKTVETGLS